MRIRDSCGYSRGGVSCGAVRGSSPTAATSSSTASRDALADRPQAAASRPAYGSNRYSWATESQGLPRPNQMRPSVTSATHQNTVLDVGVPNSGCLQSDCGFVS